MYGIISFTIIRSLAMNHKSEVVARDLILRGFECMTQSLLRVFSQPGVTCYPLS